MTQPEKSQQQDNENWEQILQNPEKIADLQKQGKEALEEMKKELTKKFGDDIQFVDD